MLQGRQYLWIAIALSASLARAETSPPRPDLSSAKPIAQCKLQALQVSRAPMYEPPAVLYTLQRPAEDPLANYERTPLGDWQMPAEADRNDPWLRLLLVGPKRPVVIDLAVFIDGKSFRDKREAWIDEVVAAAKTGASPPDANSAPAETTADDTDTGNNAAAPSGTNPQEAEADAAASEAGTNSANEASESKFAAEAKDENQDAEDAEGAENEKAENNSPGVAAKARQAPTMRDRLIHYLATNGDMVDREEIRWLIAEWGAGPEVVVLSPSLSWQRASMSPLLTYLDTEIDGALSPQEVAEAENLLKRADVDANDVLEVSELRRVTNHPPAPPKVAGYSLIVPLDANTDWDALAANLFQVYGHRANTGSAASSPERIADRIVQADAALDGRQVRQLCEEPADVTLRVDFGAANEDASKAGAVSIISVGANLSASSEPVTATTDVISVDVCGDFIEISAAQAPPADKADAGASQLAIGAVIDGNPLERLIDRDQDGRFTMRERQELGGLLAALDRNEDGQIASDEIPVPIRLGVTLGPRVHQLLAAPAGSARVISPREAAPAPPDWFVSMDKNSDRDVSRGEFLGTSEQFRQFDTDGDGLLSIAEAMKLNAGQ